MSTGKPKKGHSKEQHYAAYKNAGNWLKNKLRALKRHLRQFPDDAQALASLEKLQKGGVSYHRQRPVKRTWKRSRSRMAYANTLRKLGLKGDSVLHMAWEFGHPDRLLVLPEQR